MIYTTVQKLGVGKINKIFFFQQGCIKLKKKKIKSE